MKAEIYQDIKKLETKNPTIRSRTKKDTYEYWYWDWSNWKPIFKKYSDMTEQEKDKQIELWFERKKK